MFYSLMFIPSIQILKILAGVVAYVANQWVWMMRALGIKPGCYMMDACFYGVHS
jgi:hypothetical protein